MPNAQAHSLAPAATVDLAATKPTPPLAIAGRCMLANGDEFACEAVAVTWREATIVAKRRVALHDEVVCYLDNIGIVRGTVSRLVASGFALALDVSEDRRGRIAARLEWQANRSLEQRASPRIVPVHRAVEVRLGDTMVVQGTIIDISLSGAAIAIDRRFRPFVGALVRVGKRYATVARLLDEGIAVEFKLPFISETFNEHVVL